MTAAAGGLLLYGLIALSVAIFANAPVEGNLLAKRFGPIAWYGLSALGALAALAALVAFRRSRVLLVVSAVCLAGWVACYWLGTDQGVELNVGNGF